MSNVLKSKGFKYLKNLLIGVGASVVLIGALFKIMSWPYADEALIIGMGTEAVLFLFLGLIGPDKDYYWEKLYPGLDDYSGAVNPISQAGQVAQQNPVPKEMVEKYESYRIYQYLGEIYDFCIKMFYWLKCMKTKTFYI